jgi:hypothetical protein
MEKEVIKDWQVNDLKTYFEDKSVSSQMYDGGEHWVFSNAPLEYFCKLTGFDYKTIMNLAIDSVWADLVYSQTEDGKYVAQCLLYIDTVLNDRLSREYESTMDFLGFFTKEEEQKIGVAQWLPSNWKELMSDEQKEEIAKEWCKENSSELKDYLDENDKEEIADDYIEHNNSDVLDKAYNCLSSYEQREFIKDCIDEL